MHADMSGRSAAEMDDSQELPELPVSLRTVTPTKNGGTVTNINAFNKVFLRLNCALVFFALIF